MLELSPDVVAQVDFLQPVLTLFESEAHVVELADPNELEPDAFEERR